jgi:hypothetical protein
VSVVARDLFVTDLLTYVLLRTAHFAVITLIGHCIVSRAFENLLSLITSSYLSFSFHMVLSMILREMCHWLTRHEVVGRKSVVVSIDW